MQLTWNFLCFWIQVADVRVSKTCADLKKGEIRGFVNESLSYVYFLKQIADSTRPIKEGNKNAELRGREVRDTSVNKPTYMKGTKLERQIRARLQKGRAYQNLIAAVLVLFEGIPDVGDILTDLSATGPDSSKDSTIEAASKTDKLKSKPKETPHSDPRINVGLHIYIYMY